MQRSIRHKTLSPVVKPAHELQHNLETAGVVLLMYQWSLVQTVIIRKEERFSLRGLRGPGKKCKGKKSSFSKS